MSLTRGNKSNIFPSAGNHVLRSQGLEMRMDFETIIPNIYFGEFFLLIHATLVLVGL